MPDESDKFHPVIGYDGDAYDSIATQIGLMRGFGVTLTMEDGEQVEAVLLGEEYNEETNRLDVCFYRVTDNDWLVESKIPKDKIEQAFATRIQVH